MEVLFFKTNILARSPPLGEESLKKIKEELAGKSHPDIRYHQLDITDEKSCQKFADFIKQEHGGLDVLINNAGFAFKVSLHFWIGKLLLR